VFLNFNHSVRENWKYVETGKYGKWDSKGYAYAIGGDLKAEDFEVGCDVKLVAPTSSRLSITIPTLPCTGDWPMDLRFHG